MNHEVTGSTSFFSRDPGATNMFTGRVRIVLNEDDPTTPFAEMHVSDSESGVTKVLRYTDPAQIAIMVDLVSAIETTHAAVEVPVYVN